MGSGVSTELLAGAAGIVLGVLALIGLVPSVLVPAALVVFGGALLMGGGETYRVAQFNPPQYSRQARTEYAARATAESAGGAESLVGTATAVLGILALTGVEVAVLTLVGLLCVGGAQLLTGLATSGRMASILR